MAITINWGTRVINIPQADLTLVSAGIYELDLNEFRLTLKDLEDSEDGMNFPITHNHFTQVALGNLVLARVMELINGYTVTFENGSYMVNLVGGVNSNVLDKVNFNSVSVRAQNSAGLQVVSVGSGLSAGQDATLTLIKNILEADEEIRSATYKKKLKGTGTVIVNKNVTRTGSDIDLVEP